MRTKRRYNICKEEINIFRNDMIVNVKKLILGPGHRRWKEKPRQYVGRLEIWQLEHHGQALWGAPEWGSPQTGGCLQAKSFPRG